MPITLAPVQTAVLDTPEARAAARMRLAYHRSVLERHGIDSLSELGALNLAGAIAAQAGILVPATIGLRPPLFQPMSPARRLPMMASLLSGEPALRRGRARRRVLRDVMVTPGFVEAVLLPMLDTTFAADRLLTVAIDVAYFVAQSVDLADGTIIVLQQPHRYLTFIAERITVGQGVVFTYDRPIPAAATSYVPGDRPPTPLQAPTPDGLWGVTGTQGVDGAHGGNGFAGVSAPEIEMWVLELKGSPLFDLSGQDGSDGGRGQDGGHGGVGSDGRAEQYDWLGFCRSGAGAGGDGGPGGNGGSGGPGGLGGRLNLYAPAPVLQRYAAGGFSVSTQGGDGGQGGGPGAPGDGGAGGRLGARPRNCAMSEERHDGAPGPQGQQGATGQVGPAGGFHPDAVRFVPIDEDDFQQELTRPALLRADPPRGVAGSAITLSALRLVGSDILLMDEMQVPFTMLADTLASFVVPAVASGGDHRLTVARSDGTRSNTLSFYVLPQISRISNGERAKSGTTVIVIGTGFAEGARARVNGEDMPDARLVDPLTMTFTLRRPANIAENPDGEAGLLEVILADGVPSNGLGFTIDTLRILVLGDSVAWGQGLQTHEKYSTLVEAALAAVGGGIKSYSTMLAHSGATIGVGDATVMPPLPGEVPTSYPTVLQQLDSFGGTPGSVDLVLVTAGLNDVNIRTVLNPLNRAADFAPVINQRCHQDLRTLLVATASRFPSATVVATGYYPILSEDSDTTLISAFLIAAGLAIASLPGGVLGCGLLSQVLVNCLAFHELSTLAIAAAVDDANDELNATRVLFADPGFGVDNAALASNSWVFGINPDLTPQDKIIAAERAPACEANPDRTDVFVCRRASIGHPNAAGAQAYSAAIMQALNRGAVDEDEVLPPFPQAFLLGVATSAMQNEGGITNSDWAAFVNSPAIRARVQTLTAGETAPVSLTDMGEAIRHADLNVLTGDLDRARALGANSYRFSIEWARLQPTPLGHDGALSDADFDMAALAYYDQVLNELQARSLTPIVTLNHFSLPQWVLDPPRGQIALGTDPLFSASLRGWENPDTVDAFIEFVAYVVARWMGRVRWWITLNEPVGSMVGLGYVAGIWPPGFTGDGARARTAYYNLIRAHVRCYQAIKALSADAMVGFAHAMLDSKVTTAAVDNLLGDQEAARNQFDYFYNWHILDAVIAGQFDTNIHRRPQERTYLSGQALADWLGVDLATVAPWRRHAILLG